jgi:hypothetical protein
MGFWSGLLIGWATSGAALLLLSVLSYAGAKHDEAHSECDHEWDAASIGSAGLDRMCSKCGAVEIFK